MKRSEMVLDVIRPIIEKHLVNVVCPENVESYMAFDIIEAIEKAGMLPPHNKKYQEMSGSMMPSLGCCLWEHEDESK